MKSRYIIILVLPLIFGCHSEAKKVQTTHSAPVVSDGGRVLRFDEDRSMAFFHVAAIEDKNIVAEFAAPAKVAASIIESGTGANQNIVLFENPDLAGSYTQLIQHQANILQIQNINIKQKEIELSRIKDLQEHGAATGKDLLDAQTALAMEQTNLANEKAALIEHETKLKSGGFDPEELRHSARETIYIICNIPESQISKLETEKKCTIAFTSFPTEKFQGKVDAIADVVDNATRMIKLRITLQNPGNKIKAGMFAQVTFQISEGKNVSIQKTSVVTVQGHNYVFVEKSPLEFERREVTTGQQIANEIIIYEGLHEGEKIATEGVIQLKGLSFGY